MITNLNKEGFDALHHRYEASLARMEAWGIVINESSRLNRYKSNLAYLAKGNIPTGPRHFCDLTFSAIEADEIADIVSVEVNSDPPVGVLQRMQDLPSDPYVKTNEASAVGRSSQFELYTRALIVMGGLPCNMGNPDLSIKLREKNIQLEAKRPLGPKGVDSNFRKALSQLDKSNPGIIVMSLDHVLLGSNNVIQLERGENLSDGLNHLEQLTTEWLNASRKSLDRRLKKKQSASALLFLVKVPIYSGKLREMCTAHHMRIVRLHDYSSKDSSGIVEPVERAIGSVWGKNQS